MNSELLLFMRSRLDKLSIPYLVYLFELPGLFDAYPNSSPFA